MRRRTKIGVGMMVAFFVLQCIPIAPRVNPRFAMERSAAAHLAMTPEIQGLLRRACFDCHSNETRWPWYSRVAPVSWLVVRDVELGRKALNFSEWADRAGRRPEIGAATLALACSEARSGRMPRFPYSVLNRSARLSKPEVDTLCGWTQSEFRRLMQSKTHRKVALRAALPR